MNKPSTSIIYTKQTGKHIQQTFWQIIIPVTIFTAIIITLFVLLIKNSASSALDNVTSISLIWLLLPLLVVTVLFVIVLVALIVIIAKLSGLIPYYGLKLRTIVYKAAVVTHKIADKSVLPIIKLNEIRAGLNALLHKS